MNLGDVLRQSLAGLKKATGELTGSKGFFGGSEGFICAACHSTYKWQHYQCPQCGEMIVIPLDGDTDEEVERPG